MPSMLARLIGAVLRTTGIYRSRYSAGPAFEKHVADSRANPFRPTATMQAQLEIACRDYEGRSIWAIGPKDRAPTAHMLYFHGGGYVYPAVDVHWKYFARMAGLYGIEITAPFYPLAPEAGAKETLAWAMAAYRDFVGNHAGKFVLGGDSAGGGLSASVAQQARDSGLRQANGLLLTCPWLDIAVNHPDQKRIEPRDCILTIAGAQLAGQMYARDMALDDPRISPIHGNWAGLPPVLAFAGGDDILLTDGRALAAKLPSAEYIEGDGLMHDWPLFFFAESRRAQAKMAEFIANHTRT